MLEMYTMYVHTRVENLSPVLARNLQAFVGWMHTIKTGGGGGRKKKDKET